MKIFEKIKSFFRKLKMKKLQEPKTDNNILENSENQEKEIVSNIRDIKITTELTKKQKLEKIFNVIGIEQITINEILKNETIDINNLRKNIQTLTNLKFSNIELSIVISNNREISIMQNNILNTIINKLLENFGNENIVKELIYSNSKILNEKIVDEVPKIEKIFSEYGISIFNDYNILVENNHILTMDKSRLKKSLNLINEYTETFEKLRKFIKEEPLVVGITNINLLVEYNN